MLNIFFSSNTFYSKTELPSNKSASSMRPSVATACTVTLHQRQRETAQRSDDSGDASSDDDCGERTTSSGDATCTQGTCEAAVS